jgi:hypothetical protein
VDASVGKVPMPVRRCWVFVVLPASLVARGMESGLFFWFFFGGSGVLLPPMLRALLSRNQDFA